VLCSWLISKPFPCSTNVAQRLVGTWTLVSSDQVGPDGTKLKRFGANPNGKSPWTKSLEAYDQSTIEGQLRVSSRQVDCGVAVRDLADLERAVTSLPPAAVATDVSPPAAVVTTGAAPPPALASTGAAAPSARRLVAHKADARAASKEASAGRLSDASNPRRSKTTPASRTPYWERGRRHELDAPEGVYTTSPFGSTFAPLSYGGAGRWF
jgi:hypothetical protein